MTMRSFVYGLVSPLIRRHRWISPQPRHVHLCGPLLHRPTSHPSRVLLQRLPLSLSFSVIPLSVVAIGISLQSEYNNNVRHFLLILVVALLGTIDYTVLGATHTSATSLPLTSLCSWDYPPVYIGIYRRSPVVRFVGGSYIVVCENYFSTSSLWGFW